MDHLLSREKKKRERLSKGYVLVFSVREDTGREH